MKNVNYISKKRNTLLIAIPRVYCKSNKKYITQNLPTITNLCDFLMINVYALNIINMLIFLTTLIYFFCSLIGNFIPTFFKTIIHFVSARYYTNHETLRKFFPGRDYNWWQLEISENFCGRVTMLQN